MIDTLDQNEAVEALIFRFRYCKDDQKMMNEKKNAGLIDICVNVEMTPSSFDWRNKFLHLQSKSHSLTWNVIKQIENVT